MSWLKSGGWSRIRPTRVERVTIDDWQKRFIQEQKQPNLSDETLRKYRRLFRQIQDFGRDKGIRNAASLDLTTLDDFRATWTVHFTYRRSSSVSAAYFKFALVRKWISENPAINLKSPQLDERPNTSFPEHEMSQLLKTAALPEISAFAFRTFILTMRHSGLRISDTTALGCASLTSDDHLQLYQAKTGEYVSSCCHIRCRCAA